MRKEGVSLHSNPSGGGGSDPVHGDEEDRREKRHLQILTGCHGYPEKNDPISK